MRNLKICLVSLTFSPDSQDGSAKFFRGIYNYLINKRYNVKVITGYWNLKLKDLNIKQVSLIRKSYFWIPYFFLKVRRFLKSNNFDIIHCNAPKGSLPLLIFNKKRFISTIHDLGPFETKYSIFPIERYLFKKTTKKARYITTCSESVKQKIIRKVPKVNSNKIINLYSAIEDKFKPYPIEAEKLKQKLGIKGKTIIYVGRIALYKDIESIISAYKIAKNKIDNLNLVIGGIPDFLMKRTYNKWKKKYSDIIFTGFIPQDQLPIYYSMGDIYIAYSYASEGFGLTPIEAIACGTPVISSSIPIYKEILQDNAIFVPPKNPEILAKKIISLLKNDEERKLLVKNGQNYIKKYTWDSVGIKLKELYNLFLDK